jgi:ABC-type dipeptide/oligopeptide/nickel transport system ATPase component
MEQDIRGQKISMIFQNPQNALNPVFRIESQMTDILRVQDRHQHPRRRKPRRDFKKQAIERLKMTGIADPESAFRTIRLNFPAE